MDIDLTIHSYSLRHHFLNKPGFDVFSFVDLAEEFGLSGISLSLNDANYRHLGSTSPARMDRLRQRLQHSALSLEIDTSGTDPAHMIKMLDVAACLGATSLRTYTRHSGGTANMMSATTRDLAAVAEAALQRGVVIVLENHEDFTGSELASIIETIDHPNLKILFDYGNSQMVLEDPDAALDAVLPHVHSVHVKDHVMVRAEHAGHLTVAGVPIGEGHLPITRLTQRLLDGGLRRLTFENVWGYTAPIQTGRGPLPGVELGAGAFAFLPPPFDPARVVLDPTQLDPDRLVELEAEALLRGMTWFKGMLAGLGCTGKWINLSISTQK